MFASITLYKLAVPLISLFFIAYAWSHVLRGTKTFWGAILWTLFWGFVAAIVLFPAWIQFLTLWTGIKDQANAVFAIAIGILLFIVFHILVSIEHLQKRITDLARIQALRDAGLESGAAPHAKHNAKLPG